ncbi:MAG: hypothetical protein U0Q11_16300 [Vicinamibacterales bacterium]
MKRVGLVTAALVAAVAVWAWSLPPKRLVLTSDWSDGTVRGMLHVHSRLSDGMGTADEIAAAASRAGLQFVVLTDHGDATRPPDPPSYRSGVLVLDAVEISTRGGHYVALGLPQSPYPLGGAAGDVVEDVRRMGGFGIAAHPDSPKTELAWTDWSAPFDAVELTNPDTSWRMRATTEGMAGGILLARSLLAYPTRPAEAIAQLLTDGNDLRERWVDLAERRHVVGLAGADAHAKLQLVERDPGDNSMSVSIPSYEASFASLSVHVRPSAPFSGDASADATRLLGGLRAGAVFVAVDGWAAPASFEFSASNGTTRADMGADLDAGSPLTFHVRSNAPAGYHTILRRGSETVSDQQANTFDVAAEGRGVYVVDVRRGDGRGPAWVTSNPIYVGIPAASGSTSTTVPQTSVLSLFDGRTTNGWSFEKDQQSVIAIDVQPLVSGARLRARYGLARGALAGQFVAVAVDTPDGVAGGDGVAFRIRSDADMRVAVQVRADVPGSQPERWERSVFVSANEGEHVVRFADMTPVGSTHDQHAPAARVRSLMFVVDTTNTKPGASGQIWLGDVRLVRD